MEVDLSKAKYQFFDCVKKVDSRDRKEYLICDTVICGQKSDMIGYTLLYKKGKNVYKTIYAVVEDALVPFNTHKYKNN
jgi:hypothetical protein